jgi:hypothetical protein
MTGIFAFNMVVQHYDKCETTCGQWGVADNASGNMRDHLSENVISVRLEKYGGFECPCFHESKSCIGQFAPVESVIQLDLRRSHRKSVTFACARQQ